MPGGLKAKQRYQPKFRLPALNWSALKPHQIPGTVFNELDDDAVLNQVRIICFEGDDAGGVLDPFSLSPCSSTFVKYQRVLQQKKISNKACFHVRSHVILIKTAF